ncbi:MAG: hypothetical protein HY735_29775 [Verrucomicrobia bacterium]|nr:hypothetical protein [Verrucomicrobiota bacterium]
MNVLAETCLGHEFPGELLAGFGVASILVAPPFSIFQSKFTALSAALAAGRQWAAALFVAGVVTIFAGFLVHISKLSLGFDAQVRPQPC